MDRYERLWRRWPVILELLLKVLMFWRSVASSISAVLSFFSKLAHRIVFLHGVSRVYDFSNMPCCDGSLEEPPVRR